MAEYWNGILGGLIGSILTVVITKLLEILQKSKEHKYSLEKIFFEKKLAAAEAAITQYTILSSALSNLSVLYERIDNETNEVEEHIKEILNTQISDLLEIANDASLIVANSINLYFDLDEYFIQNQVITDFYDLINSIQPVIENRDNALQHYEKVRGTNLEIVAYEVLIQADNEVKNLLKSISSNYLKFNQQLKNVIKQIRKKMKKFDY